jgi:DNA (cytosine-5)-methyltransferase 1
VPFVAVDLQNTAIGGDVAGTLDTTRPGRGGGQAVMAYGGGNCSGPIDVATACLAHPQRQDFDVETFIAHTLRAEGHDASEDGTGRGVPLVPVAMAVQESEYGTMLTDAAGSLRADRESGGTYALTPVAMAVQEDKQNGVTVRDTAGSLRSDAPGSQTGGTLAMERFGVRRLTPTEMERLQGFPDGWTLVPYRNGMAADGPRAKALGNSMAVPVLRWLGERILKADALARSAA